MKPFKFTTANTTNLRFVGPAQTKFRGLSVCNSQNIPIYVKLYWFRPTASAAAPTVGTTVPDMTIEAPLYDVESAIGDGLLNWVLPEGIVAAEGQFFVAVTAARGDTDTTAVAANSVITLLLDGP